MAAPLAIPSSTSGLVWWCALAAIQLFNVCLLGFVMYRQRSMSVSSR